MSRWVIEHIGGFKPTELDSLASLSSIFRSSDDEAVIVDLSSIVELCEEDTAKQIELNKLPKRVLEAIQSASAEAVDYVHFTR